jgi:metal-responsive CopG/Arc/MetJ family transcriptional regulator
MRRVRTAIDLPEDLHAQVLRIAEDRGQTFSETVADLTRRGLDQAQAAELGGSEVTGLPVVHVGRQVTEEDVRSLDDEP